MGVALRAVPDDRDRLALEQGQVGVVVVEDVLVSHEGRAGVLGGRRGDPGARGELQHAVGVLVLREPLAQRVATSSRCAADSPR